MSPKLATEYLTMSGRSFSRHFDRIAKIGTFNKIAKIFSMKI